MEHGVRSHDQGIRVFTVTRALLSQATSLTPQGSSCLCSSLPGCSPGVSSDEPSPPSAGLLGLQPGVSAPQPVPRFHTHLLPAQPLTLPLFNTAACHCKAFCGILFCSPTRRPRRSFPTSFLPCGQQCLLLPTPQPERAGIICPGVLWQGQEQPSITLGLEGVQGSGGDKEAGGTGCPCMQTDEWGRLHTLLLSSSWHPVEPSSFQEPGAVLGGSCH